MNRRLIGIALVSSGWITGLFGQTPLPSPDASTAVGEAKVTGGNLAEARNSATEEAMKGVVLNAALGFLSNDAGQRNRDVVLSRVATPPRRFIQDYKLIRETPSVDVMQVELRAVPLKDKIREEMIRWGILFDRAHRPKFNLLTLQEQADRSSAKHSPSLKWTRLLASRLRGLGFVVEEGKGNARGGEADITLWGTLQTTGKNDLRANLQAAIEKPTTKLLAMQESFSFEDSEATIAGGMATLLLEKTLPAWFVQSGEGRVFDVTIDGLTSAKPYKEILDALNSGKGGFSSGFERMYAPGTITFASVYDGTSRELAEALLKLPLSVKLKATELGSTSVRLQAK